MLPMSFRDIRPGDYFCSRRRPTQIRCLGYTAPIPDGQYLGTMQPGTYFGPVQTWLHTHDYTAVFVNGWWINVWGHGIHFATMVDRAEVQRWHVRGWLDIQQFNSGC